MIENLAQFPNDPGGKILPPGGGTGIENHHVAFRCGLCYHCLDPVELVGHDGVYHRFRAPAFDHGGENGAVEFQNVPGLGVGAGRDDLVAGGNDADDRLADDLNFQHAPGDHGADGGRGHGHVAGQNHLSGAHILTDLADVLPGRGGGVDGDGTILIFHNILHHNHRVPILRDGVAGVQYDELLRA